MLEPMIAEGVSFEVLIGELFGVSPADVPEDMLEPYHLLYNDLQRALDLETIITDAPGIDIVAATDSLRSVRRSRIIAENPDVAAGVADSLSFIRTDEIEGEFYTLQNIMRTDGEITAEAHPLVFYTVIVDGKPIFASDFKDAVMFYGITSTGGHDRNPTPFEPRYPMVGMHVNLFNQIITGQFLHRLDPWVNWLIVMVLAAIMGLVVPKLSPTNGGFFMVVFVLVVIAISVAAFVQTGWWIDTLEPVIVVTLSYLAITVQNYIVEEKEKKFIKGAFANYLAPDVVEQIAENPEGLKLGGEPVAITAFFSDIQKFSAISQAVTATQLVELLNDYLTEMCDIIIKYQGTVDKFEGDAIVAFFGAPIRFEDNPTRACLASVEMQKKLAELRPRYNEEWGHWVHQRIGLNSGECVIGNMGSRSRFDYTMMGDNVNLAARLEESAKQYGIYLQISEMTYQPAKDHVEVRELDKTIVVGRSEPVTVYELLDKQGDLDPTIGKMRDLYEEGLAYYRDQKWEQAIDKWHEAVIASPGEDGDKTSQIMIERCESMLSGEASVPEDWDGVWVLTEK